MKDCRRCRCRAMRTAVPTGWRRTTTSRSPSDQSSNDDGFFGSIGDLLSGRSRDPQSTGSTDPRSSYQRVKERATNR